MKPTSIFSRTLGVSPVILVVLGYAAILAIIFLQERFRPTYIPTGIGAKAVFYLLLVFAFGLPLFGFALAVAHMVRWRRVAESCVALVLLAPVYIGVHGGIVRSFGASTAQPGIQPDVPASGRAAG
jgi:hypothetical protein